MCFKLLTEWSSVDHNNGVFHQNFGTNQFVICCIVDNIDDTVLRLIDSLLQEKFLRTNTISTSLLKKIKYGQLYFHLVENIQCIDSPLHFFYFFQKKNWRKFLCSESIYLLQFAIVLSITHKVNIGGAISFHSIPFF